MRFLSVDALAPRGWQPVTGTPFDGHLEDLIHDASRAMYGVPRGTNPAQLGIRVGATVFRDAFGRRIDGGGARSRAFAVLASTIEVELRRLIDRDVLAKRSNADQWFYFFLSAAIWPDCVSSTLWTG